MGNTCSCTCISFSNLAIIKDDQNSYFVYIKLLVVMSGKHASFIKHRLFSSGFIFMTMKSYMYFD